MVYKESKVDEIVRGLQKYWNYRAPSYSQSNIEELNNFKRDAWLKILLSNAPINSINFSLLPNIFNIVFIVFHLHLFYSIHAYDEELFRNLLES